MLQVAPKPSLEKLVADVSMILNVQPAVDAFWPRKIRCAARPVAACEGQVRDALTKANAVVAAELVSTEGLNKCCLLQSDVDGLNVNCGLLPEVDSL